MFTDPTSGGQIIFKKIKSEHVLNKVGKFWQTRLLVIFSSPNVGQSSTISCRIPFTINDVTATLSFYLFQQSVY